MTTEKHYIPEIPALTNISRDEVTSPRSGYICDICSKSYAAVSKLNRHKLLHDQLKKEQYRCPTCSFTSSRNDHLQRHLLKHLETKNFVCSVPGCAKKFQTEKQLKRQQLESHFDPKKLFVCEYSSCGCHFRSEKQLLAHKSVAHSGALPLHCPEPSCLARFRFPSQLQRHCSIHNPVDKKRKYSESELDENIVKIATPSYQNQ